MKRSVALPRDPDGLGRIIAALRVYSGQRQPKNKTERSINDALKTHKVSPAVAKRLIGNLDRVPESTRIRLLGKIAAPNFSPQQELRRRQLRSRSQSRSRCGRFPFLRFLSAR